MKKSSIAVCFAENVFFGGGELNHSKEFDIKVPYYILHPASQPAAAQVVVLNTNNCRVTVRALQGQAKLDIFLTKHNKEKKIMF